MRAGIAFARHAQSRSVARARRNADFHRFGLRDAAVAVAGGQAFCSCPVPPQRGQVRLNFMAPAIWRHIAAAIALRTGRLRRRRSSPVPWQVSQTS